MWTYCRCLIYGSYTILIHLCEVDGKLPFSSASTVLVTEVLKVLVFFCVKCFIIMCYLLLML